MDTRKEMLSVPATDGFRLAATLYTPEGEEKHRPVVLINSATGVKRSLYDKFAQYLAAQGLNVLTYDYRGIGESIPGPLREMKASMQDWGTKDLAGVVDWVEERFPGQRLVVVGHSVGGQIVGLTDRNRRISAMLAVAAQSGYWRHWSGPRRYALAFVWNVAMPVASGLLGYFPSKRIGFGEDLPGGVAREWARWCRHPDFIVDEQGQPLRPHFDVFDKPVLGYSFEDDSFAPRPAVEALLGFYRNAPKEHRHVAPADVGARAIGHFLWTKDRFRDSLWQQMASWLKQQGESAPQAAAS
jgi:predicted alpha/beta hydrolase